MKRVYLVVLVTLGLSVLDQTAVCHAAPGTGFIRNRGQVDESVEYYRPGPDMSVYFLSDALVFDLHGPTELSVESQTSRPGCAVWLSFDESESASWIEARSEMTARYNYFLGNDNRRWRTDVPAYGEIVYHRVWPGIDVVFRDVGGHIEYELAIAPEADPADFRFRYDGGTRVVSLSDGSRIVESEFGSLREWCATPDGKVGSFAREMRVPGIANSMGASILRLDNPSALLWSTFLGGGSDDQAGSGNGLVLDEANNPIVCAYSWSSDFPATPGAYDASKNGNGDAVVAKLSHSGSNLLWATFLGGGYNDFGGPLVLDSSGDIVLAGYTWSADFPTTLGAFDETYNGMSDVFVAKISGSGSTLLWSMYLGGDDAGESPGRITIDDSDNPILIGATTSYDFPITPGAYDTLYNDYVDVFITKIASSGSDLIWSTFFGSSVDEVGTGIAEDLSGNLVFAGAKGLPPSGYDDVYVAKLSGAGDSLLWYRLIDGNGWDWCYDLVLDPSANPIITGWTQSSNMPTTAGAYDDSYNGNRDAFALGLSSDGDTVLWCTYLGGSGQDEGRGVTTGPLGNIVLTGYTYSSDFPTIPGACDSSHNGDCDVFIADLSWSGGELLGSTYLGGAAADQAFLLTLDQLGRAIVVGQTCSSGFPVTSGAYDETLDGPSDLFVAKVDLSALSSTPEWEKRLTEMRLQLYPNPFGPVVHINYDLHHDGQVGVRVYDIEGRLVRRVFSGRLPRGSHAITWEGRDDAGRQVASGVYVCEVEADGSIMRSKMVIAK